MNNELRGKKKSNIEASFLIDENLVIDRRKISNEFNLFFSFIARKMNAKIHSSTLNSTHEENSENFKKFLSSSNCNSIFFETCSVEEIVDIINGIFPDVLKRGCTTPIFKKGILTIKVQFLIFQFLVKSMKSYCIIGFLLVK